LAISKKYTVSGVTFSFKSTFSPGPSPRSKWWSEKALAKAAKKLQKFVRNLSHKHFEMSSFRLNNGFRLQKNKEGHQTLKPSSEKAFLHVLLDKILHDSWSISAALARGFSDRHFERGEGPGDDVDT